ncbi:hypothetical protein [Actinotalea solisilvae]|uniref:hypothetical protein n=1 Tax=Actinotalea solisilvae TaxID=2072922 RepID=UPI0018F1BEF8|nr:hypothetical protein [Actinotalea solisilvae]
MFDRIRRPSVPEIEVEDLKAQAAGVQAALEDAAAQASVAAARLAEEAKVAAQHAREWATPRLEKALRDGAAAAAPRVERAAERSLPIVDTAHDRFVEEVLPKIVAAVNTAAAAAATGADRARDAASAKLTEIAHVEPPAPPKSHTGAKVFWVFAGAVGVAGAIAAWSRSRPTTDPWAEQPWETETDHGTDRFKAAAADVKYELGDAAEAVGEAAGGTVAHAREVSEKAAEKAREAAEKAREATRKAAPRRRAAGRSDSVLGDDEVTEAIDTPEGTMSTNLGGGAEDATPGTAAGSTEAPVHLETDPLDSEKIPTDIPGQPGDPNNTAK